MSTAGVVVLLAAAGVGVAAVASSSSSSKPKKDDVDNPPRGRVWSEPTTTTATIDARGWYMDVITGSGPKDRPCGYSGNALDPPGYLYEDCGTSCFRCKERNGEATPKPTPIRLDFGKLDGPLVVAVDVRIVDVHGIVARTKPRTRKDTSGRKRGWLDVNEFTLEGPERETVYCERLARKIDAKTLGPYLTRRKLACTDLDATPGQPYTLERALRTTTPNGPIFWKSTEWYARPKLKSQAEPERAAIGAGGTYRALYDLRIEVDTSGVVYLAGRVTPSLSPLQLQISADWRTRDP